MKMVVAAIVIMKNCATFCFRPRDEARMATSAYHRITLTVPSPTIKSKFCLFVV